MKLFYVFALYVCLAFAVDVVMTQTLHADDAKPAAVAAVPAQAAPGVQAVLVPPAAVVVPAPAAPPSWATDLLMTISKLPVIGPYVSQFLLYLGILAAILTTLVGAALSILASLHGAFNAAGLTAAATAIANFKNSKFMYWLLYFSNFNAKKNVQ